MEIKGVLVIGFNNWLFFVLYGLDIGIVEGVVCEFVDIVSFYGVRIEVVFLNDWIGKLLKEGVVVIVIVFYNGKLLSNVGQFVQWF